MSGMRYLKSRCQAHLHRMVLEKRGKYADLYRCAECDVPIYYVVDEDMLAKRENRYRSASKPAPMVREVPKPYIVR